MEKMGECIFFSHSPHAWFIVEPLDGLDDKRSKGWILIIFLSIKYLKTLNLNFFTLLFF
jgi:hypothetical protein